MSADLFGILHRHIKTGRIAEIKRALDEGTDVNLSNQNGATLLLLAAGVGNTAIGKLLIEHGADLNRRTQYVSAGFQQTPLGAAIMSGRPSFVELLLESGASLDASPFPGTLDSYIDWTEKYCRATSSQATRIRLLIEEHRPKA